MSFDMLIVARRGMFPFGSRELVSQVSEDACLSLTTRNPPTVQLELISGYLGCLRSSNNYLDRGTANVLCVS